MKPLGYMEFHPGLWFPVLLVFYAENFCFPNAIKAGYPVGCLNSDQSHFLHLDSFYLLTYKLAGAFKAD